MSSPEKSQNNPPQTTPTVETPPPATDTREQVREGTSEALHGVSVEALKSIAKGIQNISPESLARLRETVGKAKTKDLLEAEMDQPGTLLTLFGERADGERILIGEQPQEGEEIRINFTGNGSKLANRTIGAGDILPINVKYVMIRGPEGGERLGVRLTQGSGRSANRTGYFDLAGKYIPIYDNYVITIPPQQPPTDPASPQGRAFEQATRFQTGLQGMMAPSSAPNWFTTQVTQDYGDKWNDPKSVWDKKENESLNTKLEEQEKATRKKRIEQLKQFEQYEGGLQTMKLQEKQKDVFDAIATLAHQTMDQLKESDQKITLPAPRGGEVRLGDIMKAVSANPEFIAHLQATAFKESSYQQDAVSYCGAMGLFQFMPDTWSGYTNQFGTMVGLTAEDKNPFNIEGQIKLATVAMARLYYGYTQAGVDPSHSLDLVSVAWMGGEGKPQIQAYIQEYDRAKQTGNDQTLAGMSDGLSDGIGYVSRLRETRAQIASGSFGTSLDQDRSPDKVGIAEKLRLFGRNAEEVNAQLVEVSFLGKPVRIHSKLVERLNRVESALQGLSSWSPGDVQCFCWRNIRGYEGMGQRYLSNHSFGIALDMDAGSNPLGSSGTTIPMEVISVFESNGFTWGGRWQSRPDPMHFELSDAAIKELIVT